MTYCGPVPFDTTDSVLTGMATQQLQALLAQAQSAYSQFMLGSKVVTVSIAQGDGSRTVSYDRTNVSNLVFFIRQLQAMLGVNTAGRRPVRFNF